MRPALLTLAQTVGKLSVFFFYMGGMACWSALFFFMFGRVG